MLTDNANVHNMIRGQGRIALVSLVDTQTELSIALNALGALLDHCDKWGCTGEPVSEARGLVALHTSAQARFYGDEDGDE